jgi:hypothetical protein
MRLSCSFLHTEQWADCYQRNNKRTGLKNLRCFPCCSSVGHKEKGFCGMPLHLKVIRDDAQPLYAWGEFRRIDDEDKQSLASDIIRVNDVLDSYELQRRAQDTNRVSPFHQATLEEGSSRDGKVIFIFNERKRGWNYSWGASKHTSNARHCFFAYLFVENKHDDTFRCIAVCPSPSFSLYCRKRDSPVPEQFINTPHSHLPPSLRLSSSPNTNTNTIITETTVTTTSSSSRPKRKRKPLNTKRGRYDDNDDDDDYNDDGNNNNNGDDFQDMEEEFNIEDDDDDDEYKATTKSTKRSPTTSTRGSSSSIIQTRQHNNINSNGGRGRGSNKNNNNNNNGGGGGPPRHLATTTTTSSSTTMDYNNNNSNQMLSSYSLPRISASMATSSAGGGGWSSYLPMLSPTGFGSTNTTSSSSSATGIAGATNNTSDDDVIRALSAIDGLDDVFENSSINNGWLVTPRSTGFTPRNNTSTTTTTNNTWTDSLSSWRIAAVLDRLDRVLRGSETSNTIGTNQFVLEDFLKDLDMLADFDPTTPNTSVSNAINATTNNDYVIEPLPFEPASSSSVLASSSSSTSQEGWQDDLFRILAKYMLEENHLTASMKQIISQDRDGIFRTAHERRQAFVNVIQSVLLDFLRIHTISLNDFDSLLRGTGDSKSIEATLSAWEDQVKQLAFEEKKEITEIPMQIADQQQYGGSISPFINFTGKWRFDDGLIDALDSIRMIRGVPYMIRKLISMMEARVRIEQTPRRIIAHGTPRLLATGKVIYELDGELRQWTVGLPIPWKRLCDTYRSWIDDSRHCWIFQHNYSGDTLRSFRYVTKSASGDRLAVVVRLEQLNPTGTSWTKLFEGTGYALRVSGEDVF